MVDTTPELLKTLTSLIEPYTLGDPESSLQWVSKSLTHLQHALAQQGYHLSRPTIGTILAHDLHYSLQALHRTQEGGDQPDRDEQFVYIEGTVCLFLRQGYPALSIDAKKKENIGRYANAGREYRPCGKPLPVNVYDFVDTTLGKAVPYGMYDRGRNEGFVNVGRSFDTAEFAVNSIRKWWYRIGYPAYGWVPAMLFTADGGGSNGRRVRLWKVELQKLANELGIELHVCHYPPGTSKWNPIEHRLFSVISENWRGRPLESMDTIVHLIDHAGTQTGLTIVAQCDDHVYPKGRKVTDEEWAAVNIERSEFHGEWNYIIRPSHV